MHLIAESRQDLNGLKRQWQEREAGKHLRLGPTIWFECSRNKMAADCTRLVQAFSRRKKREKARSITCSGNLGAKHHSDLEPVPFTKREGQHPHEHQQVKGLQEQWNGCLPDRAARTAAIREQEGGSGVGVSREGRHTCSCRRSNSSYCNKRQTTRERVESSSLSSSNQRASQDSLKARARSQQRGRAGNDR